MHFIRKVFVALHYTCYSLFGIFLLLQIMDMSEKLWQVYNRLDPVSIDHLLIEVILSYFFFCRLNFENILLNVFLSRSSLIMLFLK